MHWTLIGCFSCRVSSVIFKFMEGNQSMVHCRDVLFCCVSSLVFNFAGLDNPRCTDGMFFSCMSSLIFNSHRLRWSKLHCWDVLFVVCLPYYFICADLDNPLCPDGMFFLVVCLLYYFICAGLNNPGCPADGMFFCCVSSLVFNLRRVRQSRVPWWVGGRTPLKLYQDWQNHTPNKG